MKCLLVFTVVAGLGTVVSHAATLTASRRVAHPQAELETAAHVTVQQGLHAELPPHISTLLGLTHEERCAVMQGVLRASGKIQGIDVTEKNHNDIVIFTVDQTSMDQTFYLTSPGGVLRRMLLVRQGEGHVVKPTEADVDAFQREKKIWKERLASAAR